MTACASGQSRAVRAVNGPNMRTYAARVRIGS